MERLKVLFLCTGNSCRSQMAEGWARALRSDEMEVWSAGIETHGLNPLAVEAMAREGVDISGQRSVRLDAVAGIDFDLVVTVCDNARESCPVFPGRARVIHRSFDDPPRLARDAVDTSEALIPFRRVCREIRDFIADWNPREDS